MTTLFVFPETSHTFIVLPAIFIVYYATLAIYNLFFHPLRDYPGPKTWAVSRLPYVYSLCTGRYAHDLRRLHDKYGKWVRTGPEELSIIEPKAWRDIYGYGGTEYDYNPIWTPRSINGAWSIIFAPKDDHTRMKRVIGPAFSMAAVREQEPIIQTYVTKLVDILQQKTKEKSAIIDINSYLLWTTFDMIGDLQYGEPFGSLDNDECHPWVDFVMRNMKYQIFMASMNFYPWIKSFLGLFVPKSLYEGAKKHFDYSTEKLYRRIDRGESRKDIMGQMLKEGMQRHMTRPEIEATGALITIGAAETTSSALTAAANLLVRNPRTLKKLQDELRSTFDSEDKITFASIEHLEYLNAVLKESMRYAPPVPMQVPFQSPLEGGYIAGRYIPPNIMVGVPQLPCYRYHEHFALANEFIPERWLENPQLDGISFENDCKEAYRPFILGPRNCLGVNVAWAEMRAILAKLIWQFDLKSPHSENSPEATFKYEEQKTFATWHRGPCFIHIHRKQ